jgi:hypothetical protein
MNKPVRVPLSALALGALAAVCITAPAASAKPAAGPKISNCAKLKQPAKTKCLTVNQANTLAFNQIKNSKFVGYRGDGQGIEDTYCANGRYESRTSDSYGTGISEGKRWSVENAVVKQGGKWINAFITAPEGFEVALQRRGEVWKFGIASLGRILEPGVVEKTDAAAECKTL